MPSPSRRTTRMHLACVLSDGRPYTTCTPASSIARPHWMFARSSKRALTSTKHTACLPRSDARRVVGRAVHGLLDREHVRVVGRLLDEALDRADERVVRVVDEDVALAH